MEYTKPRHCCRGVSQPTTSKWVEWGQRSAAWAKCEAKCSREIDKKSGIANYCLCASYCLLSRDYNSSAPRTVSEPTCQLLFFLLAFQTKTNKQTNSLPSSPVSSPFSLPPSSSPPHFLPCHPTPPRPAHHPISFSQLLQRLIHSQHSCDIASSLNNTGSFFKVYLDPATSHYFLVQVTISHLSYCSSLLCGLLVSSFASPFPLVFFSCRNQS